MMIGDLVRIIADCDQDFCGFGLFLGQGYRGKRTNDIYKFLWNGRLATFDKIYWRFEIVSEYKECIMK